jgi:hypothetical protein
MLSQEVEVGLPGPGVAHPEPPGIDSTHAETPGVDGEPPLLDPDRDPVIRTQFLFRII